MRFMMGLLVLSCLGWAGPALACGPEVRIQFAEDSPDRFQITFERGPKLRLMSLRIDLGKSAGGAFFDGNDGIDIQQPSPSGVTIRSVEYDQPEGSIVTLTFDSFVEKRSVVFWSDLDDRGLSGDPDQNHIVDGELAGAAAHATLVSETGRRIEIDGLFDKKSHAQLGDKACV